MKYKLTTLSNGLRVLYSNLPNLPSVALTIWIGVGSRFESEKLSGIGHFLEHMVFKGTPKRPSPLEVSKAIDSLGAESNAGTSKEWTNFYLKARSDLLPKAFDILADILLNPLLKSEEIAREKGVIIQEIAMKEDIPMEKVGDNFISLIFGKNALGRDIAGTASTVKNITRDDFISYRERHYDTQNMLLTVSGGSNEKEVLALAEKLFGKLTTKKLEKAAPFVPDQTKPRIHLESKKSEQAHFILGFPGYHRTHKDRYAETLLATILGRGMSSRLFIEVREKLGLAYTIGTSVSRYVDTGVFATYAGVDVKKVEETIKVVLDQTYGLGDGRFPIEGTELTKGKEYLKGRMALALEDTLEVNDFYGKQVLFKPEIKNPEDIFDEIDKVTEGDIIRVAKDIFKPEKLNLAVIGP